MKIQKAPMPTAIVLEGTFSGVLKSLRSFGKRMEYLEKASGVIIILVGFYFIWIA